jgi:hypothetical protein
VPFYLILLDFATKIIYNIIKRTMDL